MGWCSEWDMAATTKTKACADYEGGDTGELTRKLEAAQRLLAPDRPDKR